MKTGEASGSASLTDAVLEALPIGVCLTDETGYYRLMNNAYCAIYEYVREEMIGRHYSIIMPPDQVALANEHYARLLQGDTGIPTERKRQRKNGTIIYIEAANALVKLADGSRMVITTVRDITERKQMQAELQKANDAYKKLHETLLEQATRDSLTGLFNRRHLNETIERELALAKREEYPVSVVILDIDLFKEINDAYGHMFGDEALQRLSRLIVNNIRAGDIAYRYGGDEFVVVMPGAELEAAENRANKICSTFRSTFMKDDGRNIPFTISAGIALYPRYGPNGTDILHAADQALYQAKQGGRNLVCVWEGK